MENANSEPRKVPHDKDPSVLYVQYPSLYDSQAVFRVYQMDYPDYDFYDTLCASRRSFPDLENHQLYTVAAECGYQLENHHHALADAEACAWIAREIL